MLQKGLGVRKAEKEGTLVNCASVRAEPRTCAAIFVGKPVLAIEKTGPATALLGSDVSYNVVVRNTGTSVAKNVVVTDPVPQGMGGQPVTVNVGDLGPGQSRPITVTFKANQRGEVCNTATANSSGLFPILTTSRLSLRNLPKTRRQGIRSSMSEPIAPLP